MTEHEENTLFSYCHVHILLKANAEPHKCRAILPHSLTLARIFISKNLQGVFINHDIPVSYPSHTQLFYCQWFLTRLVTNRWFNNMVFVIDSTLPTCLPFR